MNKEAVAFDDTPFDDYEVAFGKRPIRTRGPFRAAIVDLAAPMICSAEASDHAGFAANEVVIGLVAAALMHAALKPAGEPRPQP